MILHWFSINNLFVLFKFPFPHNPKNVKLFPSKSRRMLDACVCMRECVRVFFIQIYKVSSELWANGPPIKLFKALFYNILRINKKIKKFVKILNWPSHHHGDNISTIVFMEVVDWQLWQCGNCHLSCFSLKTLPKNFNEKSIS